MTSISGRIALLLAQAFPPLRFDNEKRAHGKVPKL
jgi:hypothetical protein